MINDIYIISENDTCGCGGTSLSVFYFENKIKAEQYIKNFLKKDFSGDFDPEYTILKFEKYNKKICDICNNEIKDIDIGYTIEADGGTKTVCHDCNYEKCKKEQDERDNNND